MKRITILFLGFVVASSILLTSCKKDSTQSNAPVLTLTGGNNITINSTATTDSIILQVGANGKAFVSFSINVTAEATINSANSNLRKIVGLVNTVITDFGKSVSADSSSMSYTLNDSVSAGITTYQIVVVDREAYPKYTVRNLVVKVSVPLLKWTGVTLYSGIADPLPQTTLNSLFSVKTGTSSPAGSVVTRTDYDFGFYYSATGTLYATLAATSALTANIGLPATMAPLTWLAADKRGTAFQSQGSITIAKFDAVVDDASLVSAFGVAAPTAIFVNSLETVMMSTNGSILAVKLSNGKKALLKITNITQGNPASITFDIKSQTF